MDKEPAITVGILDRQCEIRGSLNGDFFINDDRAVSGKFVARAASGTIVLTDEQGCTMAGSSPIRLASRHDSTFTLFNVVIGIDFHWERREDQTFQGSLILMCRNDETIVAINDICLEDYLQSVISSEMSADAPPEFLKTHAILSRSWLLRTLERKRQPKESLSHPCCVSFSPDEKESMIIPLQGAGNHQDETIRWYEQEDHDLFDVCADDHCQRYQGITKIISGKSGHAVRETRGQVITYNDEICDARYSKACGGITESFATAWGNVRVPYLVAVSDSPTAHPPIHTEEQAARWILSEPEAYCNTKDVSILDAILPGFDRETTAFFRWKIAYPREDLEKTLREKSGIDFGILKSIEPLSRGPSGRIYRLRIVGSKQSAIVGKELEIRRWLSKTHLYSSAFVVTAERSPQGDVERFIFDGAGWGHGVGLCQIGAAVMATRGFTAGEILGHYFPGTEVRKIY